MQTLAALNFEALQRLASIVEPLMPTWATVVPYVAIRGVRVEVFLQGASRKHGREIIVIFGEHGIERFALDSEERRLLAEARVRVAAETAMCQYDDGRSAKPSAKLDTLVINLEPILLDGDSGIAESMRP